MSDFLAQINKLRFPLHPLCEQPHQAKFTPLAQSHHASHPMFPHLDHQGFKLTQGKGGDQLLKTVGVVFSGGQASGGHNVIWGLYETFYKMNPEGKLIGFLGGPSGIIENQFKHIKKEELTRYINTGGFDLLGSGRTKIQTPEQLEKSFKTIEAHNLEALIIIGGDDSNTNAALLANFLKQKGSNCAVCGVPKTIDGDLKNGDIEVSFGFDSASKLFSELASNIARDCLSAKKYTHFIKIMGRSASHLALETALNVHPNLTLISEEVAQKKQSLADVVDQITDLIIQRSNKNKNYGIILIPEGLIESMHDVLDLLNKLCKQLKAGEVGDLSTLNFEEKTLYDLLPQEFKKQLVQDLDPHGNIQVSLIETERLLVAMVKESLKHRDFKGKFSPICHFFGYEGRACYPTYFDMIYSYHLGAVALLMAHRQLSGYIASITNLKANPDQWILQAIPLSSMIHTELRQGVEKPVIQKNLVDLNGQRFKDFSKNKQLWALEDAYQFNGPSQYFGSFDQLYHPPLILKD